MSEKPTEIRVMHKQVCFVPDLYRLLDYGSFGQPAEKTPALQYVQKRAHGPRAPHDSCDCGKRINGIAQLRPFAYKKMSKRQKTVSRPYGGVLCAGCVKSRIVRAFLLE